MRVAPRKRPSSYHSPSGAAGRALVAKHSSNSVKRRRGGAKIQKQRFTSATVDGNSRPGPSTKVGPVLRVKDPVPWSGNPFKRPYIQRGVGPVLSSDAKQSQGVSIQHVELIVIVDMEPESSEDDENPVALQSQFFSNWREHISLVCHFQDLFAPSLNHPKKRIQHVIDTQQSSTA
jgi:hypothetical protein